MSMLLGSYQTTMFTSPQGPSFPFVTNLPADPTTPPGRQPLNSSPPAVGLQPPRFLPSSPVTPGTHAPSIDDSSPNLLSHRSWLLRSQALPTHARSDELLETRINELSSDSGLGPFAISVYQVLKYTSLLDVPNIYKPGALKGTRGPTQTDYQMSDSQQLKHVVYVPSLISQLHGEAERILGNLMITDSAEDNILGFLMGSRRYMGQDEFLPWTIHSEHDTEDWVLAFLLRPAIAAAVCALAGTIVHEARPNGPNICAGDGLKSIPDSVLFNGTKEDASTIEIKTHSALEVTTFSQLKTLNHLPPGSTARFNWPTNSDTELDTQSKLLVQVNF